jgi:hypothetical protein
MHPMLLITALRPRGRMQFGRTGEASIGLREVY